MCFYSVIGLPSLELIILKGYSVCSIDCDTEVQRNITFLG